MNTNLDYNLLKILVLIKEYRNLKDVAIVLGKTESAVSKYLSKLRIQLGDQLFIRTKNGLEPTIVLNELLPEIQSGLNIINSAIYSKGMFNVENHKETIRIAIHPSLISEYGLKIFSSVRALFKKPKIAIETWNDLTSQHIQNNKIQIGVSFMHEERSKMIYQSKLIESDFVVVTSKNNPSTNWREALSQPLVYFKVNDWNNSRSYFSDFCKNENINLDYKVITDNFPIAISLVKYEDMSLVSLKQIVNDSEVKIFKLPYFFGVNYPIVSCVKLSNRNNPLHMELNDIISKIVL